MTPVHTSIPPPPLSPGGVLYGKRISVGCSGIALRPFGICPSQVQQLLARPDLVVCTPGRMIDLLEAEVTSMRLVSYLVLDEADRMLDMGFERQLRQIVGCVRPDRQTLMWSATWPKDVRQIGRDFLRAPVLVTIGGLDARANPDIRQRIHFCEDRQKPSWLMGLFRDSILRRKVVPGLRGRDPVTVGWPRMCEGP